MADKENYRGSEIHRLKVMPSNYDIPLFERLYRICKPVIRNLVRQIDCRRFNLTPDIIHSYFVDKMLYVFSKYQGTCSEEHLQAKILLSLSTYKNKLLRAAYGEEAEANLEMEKLEDLFDNDKELLDTSEEDQYKEECLQKIENYMEEHLNGDAFLLFKTLLDPPEFIQVYPGNGQGNITAISLVKFFGLPSNRASIRYITDLRRDVDYWVERAKKDLA